MCEWARGVVEAAHPWAVEAAPPDFIMGDEAGDRLRRSYGPNKYRRLVALKDAYDPDNVFAVNQSNRPSAAADPLRLHQSRGDSSLRSSLVNP